MERKAKQLGIKLSYVRNGKRYRKTDKQLYNAINGKLKTLQFGEALTSEEIGNLLEEIAQSSRLTESKVKQMRSAALTGSIGFLKAIGDLLKNRLEPDTLKAFKDQLIQVFITNSTHGYSEVFMSGKMQQIDYDDFKDKYFMSFRRYYDGEIVQLVIYFIMYCKPEYFMEKPLR